MVIMSICMALTCNLTPALRSPKRAMMTCNTAWRGNKPLCGEAYAETEERGLGLLQRFVSQIL